MSETGISDCPSKVSLESLQSQGAQGFDPVRFQYLQALSNRMQKQHGAVRRALEDKLQVALRDYGDRYAQPAKARQAGVTHQRLAGLRALAVLNRYLGNLAQEDTDVGLDGDAPNRPEMKSVRQFKQALSKQQAQDQVVQAVSQGPENAGPLNSHSLVLRSLTLMRELSPDYLQKYLSHVDALLWLDKLNLKPVSQQAKPARRSRPKA
jgi:hypothetical protein